MKSLAPKLLIIVVLLLVRLTPATGSYFTSAKSLDTSTISSGYWSVHTAPVSGANIAADKPFNIDYTVDPEDYSGEVKLCFSYNLAKFVCPSELHTNSGSFAFNFPQGEGLYTFKTIALAGEDETLDAPTQAESLLLYSVQYDTTPPTSFLDLGHRPVFMGQNLLSNGQFLNQGVGWQTPTPSANIQYVSNSDTHNQTAAHLTGTTWISQTVPIPLHVASDLSFWFHMIASDSVDTDRFSVELRDPDNNNALLSTIFVTGSGEALSTNNSRWYNDSGWRHVVSPVYHWMGDNVTLWFGLDNLGGSSKPEVYLTDVNLSTTGLVIGTTTPVVVESHDTGSGVEVGTTTPVITPGVNDLNYSDIDIVGNTEPNNYQQLTLLSSIVLNKVNFADTPQSVELYNNSSQPQILNSWSLKYGDSQVFDIGTTVTIPANSSIGITLPIDQQLQASGDTVDLYFGSIKVDSTTFTSTGTGSWLRTPDGLGTWSLKVPTIDYRLTYRPDAHRLLLTIDNIPAVFGNNTNDVLSYDLIYQGNDTPQNITGTIKANTIVNGKTDREFYLGTCSHETCTPDVFTQSLTATLSVTGSINSTPVTYSHLFSY